MDKIRRAWESFIQNGTGSNAVREVVAASWKRSQGYHIPVERGEAPLAPEAEAVRLRSEHAALITAARPALEQARFLLAEASSIIILTDPSGVIIETAGDPRTTDFGRIIHLEQGGHWAEADIGTNAIGTAIAAVATDSDPWCRAFLQRSPAMDVCSHSDLASHLWRVPRGSRYLRPRHNLQPAEPGICGRSWTADREYTRSVDQGGPRAVAASFRY